jgi:spore maturation protein CgeB
MDIVILGLSITSSWGNGHATTYRGLVRELNARGHRVLFLERDVPWYADNRDLPKPKYCRVGLYESLDDLERRFVSPVRDADAVIVGSYVPNGVAVGEWVTRVARGVTAFYDIDTPVTLSKLERGDYEYLAPKLIPRFDMYLSFTGGPTLRRIERRYGAPVAHALYCSVDPELYFPELRRPQWDLGYMGTYSDDRQPVLDRLLLDPARRMPEAKFAVVGPQYPRTIRWPKNVERVAHLPPRKHRAFYNAQRFTLNVTRADMVAAGWSPSVRLFEAAACGTPIISDAWEGLDQLFTPDSEILIARTPSDTLRCLHEIDETERLAIGRRARAKVLARHTAAHRAAELERYVMGVPVEEASAPEGARINDDEAAPARSLRAVEGARGGDRRARPVVPQPAPS